MPTISKNFEIINGLSINGQEIIAANGNIVVPVTDSFARSVANSATENITIIQGVNNTQNTRIQSIETINDNQNTSISIIQGVDVTQNTRLNSLETVNNNQNTSISIIQGVNDTQNTTITSVNQFAQAAFNQANTKFSSYGGTVSGDTIFNGNVTVTGTTFYANTVNLRVEDNIITLNSNVTGTPTQDSGIEINRGTSPNTYLLWKESDGAWEFTNDGTNYDKVAGLNYVNAAFSQSNTNSSDITIIQGVDNTQNTRLNSIETVNTEQNTSITIIQGIDLTQNTRLDSIETINSDQNTSISIIQGVDTWQNTQITYVNQFAQAAFDQANTGGGGSGSSLSNGTSVLELSSNGIIFLPQQGSIYNNTVVLATDTADQVLDSYELVQFRTSKYTIQTINGSDIHSSEVIVTHNDNNVYMTEYGIVQSANLYVLNSQINGSTVELTISPNFADTTVDFIRTSVASRVLSGIQGDLMTQSGTEDLNTGSGTTDLNV